MPDWSGDGEEMSYKTRSDSLMLRRQIRHLKESGSDLGDDLESDAASFLSGVQIVRTRNRNIPEVFCMGDIIGTD